SSGWRGPGRGRRLGEDDVACGTDRCGRSRGVQRGRWQAAVACDRVQPIHGRRLEGDLGSLVVAGDAVLVQGTRPPVTSTSWSDVVLAFDTTTGAQLWESSVPAPGDRIGPLAASGGALFEWRSEPSGIALLRLDPRTGAVQWRADVTAIGPAGILPGGQVVVLTS